MNQELRIGHVISPKTWRGGEQQAIWLYEDLDKLGVYQIIFCVSGSATEKYCREHGIRYRAFRKRLSLDVVFARNLAKSCKEENIQILHPHGSGGHTLALLSIDLFHNSCSIVLHRRVDFPISDSWLSRYKYNHPQIKKILCVSEAIREIMIPSIKRKEILDVIYDGIDIRRFQHTPGRKLRNKFHFEDTLPLIGNVAALTQQKDYFTFIDTVEELNRRGVRAHFLAIGDGKQSTELKEYAKSKGVDSFLTFTGFRHDIPEILPELDIFLFTSETEGLGTSILDAFAAGVPVVSTNAGGIPEIVHHLKNGFLAEVKNPRLLADGVELALNKEDEKCAWIKQARLDVESFSREKMAAEILKRYIEIIASEKH
ncbi:MAG: glycosyltransferase [Bacteroidetes bacterium]|nr:glycosyltransferase [Bacteroidota bacterium]